MSKPDHRDEEVLRRMYVDERMSTRQIANDLGCAKSTVQYWLDKHDIDTRPSTHDKPPNFRTNQLGYEELRTRAGGERQHAYVHRLLAVARFGLDAVRGVDVHHKNDVPWDNRPENLALITRSEHVKQHHEEGDYDRHLRKLHDDLAWRDAEVGDL